MGSRKELCLCSSSIKVTFWLSFDGDVLRNSDIFYKSSVGGLYNRSSALRKDEECSSSLDFPAGTRFISL